jgi:hypothetical protein
MVRDTKKSKIYRKTSEYKKEKQSGLEYKIKKQPGPSIQNKKQPGPCKNAIRSLAR